MTKYSGADAVGIAESNDTVASDHSDHSIPTTDTLMHSPHGLEDNLWRWLELTLLLKLVRENIQ